MHYNRESIKEVIKPVILENEIHLNCAKDERTYWLVERRAIFLNTLGLFNRDFQVVVYLTGDDFHGLYFRRDIPAFFQRAFEEQRN
jgi:hypothetical protein